MKYTDTMFSLPVRVYDGFQARKNYRKEEALLEELDAPLKEDWVVGVARIPIQEVVGWVEQFSPGRKVEDVAQQGFDLTIVFTNTLGDFECTWDRKRFEDRLNEFANKHDDVIEQAVDEALAIKEAELQAREDRLKDIEQKLLKKPWHKKILHNIALSK